jgi:hypothetical protein
MAKRKPSPKATYTYVPDEKAPVKSKLRGKTGGIKKEKTSADKPASRRGIVDPREGKQSDFRSYKSADEVRAENEGVRLKEAAEVRERKAADRELGAQNLSDLPAYKKDKFASRKAELEASISETPMPSSPRPKRKPMRAVAADKAAGPAIVPGRGTAPGTPPAKPDRGAEFGGAMVVGKGAGAPDALSGGYAGSKVGVKKEPITVKKKKKDVPVTTAAGVPMTREVLTSAPKIEATNSETREMRSAGSIKETRRKAKRRLPGGLKTTEYRPMDIAGRSTSGERKRKRAAAKLAKRIASGKIKLPSKIGESALAAQTLDRETAQAKNPKATVSVPSMSEYTYSHEAMAQELARVHFPDHSATEIMDYVKHSGSDMPSFHRHVTEAHSASTKKTKVGPPGSKMTRSAGKITRWSIDPSSGEYKESRSYEGWHQTKTRDEQGRNIKVYKKFRAPKGSLTHTEYLNAQIHAHKERKAMEAQDTREANRQRRQDRATSALTAAMSGGEAAPKTERPPLGTGGAYISTKPVEGGGTTSERVPRKRPKFVEVKKPKKRLSLD